VLITDLTMPEMDGIELARQAAAISAGRHSRRFAFQTADGRPIPGVTDASY
jgi:CheY-like chemotaxis protein